MPYFLVLFRTFDSLKDFFVYTKQCSEMVLDLRGGQTKLYFALNHTLPDFWKLENAKGYSMGPVIECINSSRPHLKVNHLVFQKDLQESAETQIPEGEPRHERQNLKAEFNRRYSVPDLEQYAQNEVAEWEVEEQHIFIVPQYRCTFFVNGHLASCLASMVHRSQKFRRRFFKNVARFRAFRDCVPDYRKWDLCLLEDVEFFAVPYMIDVVAVWPLQRLDYSWGWRMNMLATKRMVLEETMAWLSTLGGAHSSLGEYYKHHAEIAGQLSMKQIRIALEMGDPITVARCHMFWVFSLIQRGYTHKAKTHVRKVYKFVTSLPAQNKIVINMCLAAWTRLQHLNRIHRRQKLAWHHHNNNFNQEDNFPEHACFSKKAETLVGNGKMTPTTPVPE